jgi:hypothetical protein
MSQIYSQAGDVLVSLSPLISQSVVPIEDWISTVYFLIASCSKESPEEVEQLHSAIHSICLACTSSAHVRSLVDDGILWYWEKALVPKQTSGRKASMRRELGLRVAEAISHLTSIDQELSARIDRWNGKS